LRASEEQYRVIFDGSADALALWNKNIRMVDVNAAMSEMYGFTRDEVVGRSYSDRMPRDAVEKRIGMIRRALAGEQGQLETIGVRKDGECFDVELRFLPIDYRGEPHVLVTARDITERRRAEQALRTSEEQYRAIFDGSADAVALWDREVRIVDVNAAFTTMYRYTREEVVGKSYSDSIPRDAVEKRLAVFRRALAGEPGQLETVGVKGDGEHFDVELRFLPIDVRGAPHVLVIARDITERKRTEQVLQASEEQYRAIFNATDDALVLRDAQFRVVDVNAAYEAMSGMRRAEVIGISELTLTRYATAIDRRALHAEALAGRTVHFEAEGRRVDGTPFLLEVRGIPMIYRGAPHVLYIGRDATERKAAEAALRASEEQYRSIFNAAADALVLRDADFRIVDVNATYEAMSGRSREEVLGADRVLANPPEVNASIKALHQKALAGEPIVFETQLIRRDGTRYDLELRGVPIRHRGAPHVLYMGRDITARRRAEDQQRELQAQLRQVQKMEAIGQLTGGIAHDFNNILAAIMGYVGLALERPTMATDVKLAGYLEQAEQGCRRARDLIQQMLAFSRGRRGERRALPLAGLIDESLRLLRATFPSSIVLEVEAADEAAVAEVDPVQLQQVLLNLGINARDAIGSTGRIRFGVRQGSMATHVCASCGQSFSGAFHRLWVADSGPGISPQLRNRIFEPFFSTKAPGRGTGMGLATVHRIVHDHGGHLLVESDDGARFEVLLPAGSTTAAAAQPVGAEAPEQGRESLHGRVLLVDDEESVLGFMRELLQSWGLDVVAVRQSPAARDLLAADGPALDLLLTDQTMPELSGVDLAHAAQSLRPDLPVLLYSGHADLIDVEALKQTGIRRVLRKPLEPAQLRSAIEDCLPARQ
jgi:PAS domain S-box-containing protein